MILLIKVILLKFKSLEKIEEFLEILLSNFQSFVPKTDPSLTKLLRNQSQRKLPKIYSIIAKIPEFRQFNKVGRIKFNTDANEFMYFDISLRIPQNNFDSYDNKVVEFILNDVTQVIQVENDKNDIRFKSILLAKIAHEFKNPINTINAISSILNTKIMQNPEVMQAIQKIQNINDNSINNFNFIMSLCDYLLFLIEDLNTFVKLGLGKKSHKGDKYKDKDSMNSEPSNKSFTSKMTVLNLSELLDFCYNLFFMRQAYDKGKPNLKIIKNYSNIPDKFFTNEIKLKQVIINLLSNAYKFTISGFVSLNANLIKTPDDKSKVLFSVTDTGSGLDKEEISSIFIPFEVSKQNQHNCHGSGLGLSIVADILELFESKIKLESKVGQGSTFSFEIENKIQNNLSNNKILELEHDEDYEDLDDINFNKEERGIY